MKRAEGFFATLDVLGFSEMLNRSGYVSILQRYLDTINKVIAGKSSQCVVFSDSIVLTSQSTDEDEDGGFRELITTCSEVFRALLAEGIPVRGAVSYGSYWRETSNRRTFLAGRPIVEAYEREKAQKWVGILLCPSIYHKISDLRLITWLPEEAEDLETAQEINPIAFRLQPVDEVPFQEGNSRQSLSGYAVVPMKSTGNPLSAWGTMFQVILKLESLRLQAPNPSAQTKYDASIKWLTVTRLKFRKVAKLVRARSTSAS